jgi:hypothetical protein
LIRAEEIVSGDVIGEQHNGSIGVTIQVSYVLYKFFVDLTSLGL